jgi:alkylation response protein AidB-like acyl-CoA dehydrogenase
MGEQVGSAASSVRGLPSDPGSDASSVRGLPSGDEVREEVAGWLAANWRKDIPSKEWLATVVDAGWAAPTWSPQWYGRGWPAELAVVVRDEFARVGAPGTRQDVTNLWANTMLAFGSDELKQQFVRRLLTDDVVMCLLYSEPGAGSDLAGLQTRAERDGDEWIVNGQKVWTSGGHRAEFGMLVARTNWDVPKHRGITFFWFPMRQPGVEVRPIKQITKEAHFNEVFITDARVPDTHRLGDLNDGWRVLQTALAYERSVMGEAARGPKKGDAADERGGTMGHVDLKALAQQVGRNHDPVVRQEIVRIHTLRTVNTWNQLRAKAALAQGTSSAIMSLGKLAMSRILHEDAAVQADILGAEAMLDGPDNRRADAANFLALNAYFTSIGGGTDQIQRNIIGERVLGLPKEPELDRDVAFKDVRKATVTR